jgi:hypothetical protein
VGNEYGSIVGLGFVVLALLIYFGFSLSLLGGDRKRKG